MNTKAKLSIIFLIVGVIVVAPFILNFIAWQLYIMDPNIVQHKREAYHELSSTDLVKKLSFWNPVWYEVALDEMAKRKDVSVVPDILNLLHSKNEHKRDSAMRALAKIGDARAVPFFMSIIHDGENHPDYYKALASLSEMKREEVYPYVIRWSEREDGYRNGSIRLIKEFDKQEGISALRKIEDTLDEIQGDDWNVSFSRKEIKEAIKYLSRHSEDTMS